MKGGAATLSQMTHHTRGHYFNEVYLVYYQNQNQNQNQACQAISDNTHTCTNGR